MGRGIEAAGRGARENLGFGRARGVGLPPHEFARGAELAVKPLQLPGLPTALAPGSFLPGLRGSALSRNRYGTSETDITVTVYLGFSLLKFL